MSDVMFVLNSHFTMRKNQFDSALIAIKSLKGMETCGQRGQSHFMWLPVCDLESIQTIEEMFALWRWPVDCDDTGNINSITFSGEKFGDEDLFFTAIGPYISSESEITVMVEDKAIWQWKFDGDKCEKKYGRVVFD